MDAAQAGIHVASPADGPEIGRLLHAFNREFEEPTPDPGPLGDRVRALMAGGDTDVLLAGAGPDAVAVLRFRESIWVEAAECYLAELYVTPAMRGRGLGRALLGAAIEHARSRGASYMELGTSEDDLAARRLYESVGFSNREGRADGPVNFYYELDLQPG
jgi:GNAT superfamily N-acetyltransferase